MLDTITTEEECAPIITTSYPFTSNNTKSSFLIDYIESTGLQYRLASTSEVQDALDGGFPIAALVAPDRFLVRLRCEWPTAWRSSYPNRSFRVSAGANNHRSLEVGDPHDPLNGWQSLDSGDAKFTYAKVKKEGEHLAIYLGFNPTVDVLTCHVRGDFSRDYRVPKLTGYGKKKTNHFHPLYLNLPMGFDFSAAMLDRFLVYEKACDLIEAQLSEKLGEVVRCRRDIITAEHYKDFVTRDPVMTFGQLAFQIGRGLGGNAKVKGFDNSRTFLSIYAWNGPEKETAQFNYIGLSVVPKASAKADNGVIIRAEVRRKPNRQAHGNFQVEIPHPSPVASYERISHDWILRDWFTRVTSPLGTKKSLALLHDGFVRVSSASKAELDAVLGTPGLGQVLELKVQRRRAKNGSMSVTYNLYVSTNFRLQLALATLTDGLLPGQFDDRRLLHLMNSVKSSPEYLHRRLRDIASRAK